MLVLHGTIVSAYQRHPNSFVLWAETPPPPARRRTGTGSGAPKAKPAARPHPFVAPADALRDALVACLGGDPETMPADTRATVRLPSTGGRPLPSPALAGAGPDPGGAIDLLPWRVPGFSLDCHTTLRFLLRLGRAPAAEGIAIGDDLRYWTIAARFAGSLVARGRVLPGLERAAWAFRAGWQAIIDRPEDVRSLSALIASLPPAARAVTWETAADLPEAHHVVEWFLTGILPAYIALGRPASPPAPIAGAWDARSIGEKWVDSLLTEAPFDLQYWSAHSAFAQYEEWIRPLQEQIADLAAFRLCLRLDPPGLGPEEVEGEDAAPPAGAASDPGAPLADPEGGDAAAPAWTLHYLLQATDDPSLFVPAAEIWRRGSASADLVGRRLDNPQERLLGWLARAARHCPPIEASLRDRAPTAAALTAAEAIAFIREAAPALEAAGFGVLIPSVLADLRLRLRLGRSTTAPGTVSGQAQFGWSTVVDYDWKVAIGGEEISPEEFQALARLKEPLVQVRGQWVMLRPDQIDQALTFFKRRRPRGDLSVLDAIKLSTAPVEVVGREDVEVERAAWVEDLLAQIREAGRQEVADEPPGFEGHLRSYQKRGVGWLATLRRAGLGACLADDMGLGKTIQVIALLLRERAAGTLTGPMLLVCPTSVVGNWQREVERFAPSLRVLIHHGAGRIKDDFPTEAARYDLVISTYALLHRDEPALAQIEWAGIVLDEAQNIKNAATRAAQTARRLRTGWRAALTGTPVENRLADLWSIFQFLNPGYLGSAEDFRKRFAGPIERKRDEAVTARLQALVAPFILRRVKTDRAIIADLPEKNEMKVFCPLTREQATLYEAIVRDSLHQIEEAEGLQRRGLILATLTKLKQVCDHPALFLHDESTLAGRSGKLTRLGEMLEEVAAVGDRALIFTQYAEMGRHLRDHLAQTLGVETLFLHGGTPAKQRDKLVARFQADDADPLLFVLSIKAGGTGLNLTRANHVFHFDRWWNPAVENQATDRAFRIGQRRDVQVHKLICSGTFEEALDKAIERKLALAEAIVGTGENWITEMSTAELRDLFALRRDEAVAV